MASHFCSKSFTCLLHAPGLNVMKFAKYPQAMLVAHDVHHAMHHHAPSSPATCYLACLSCLVDILLHPYGGPQQLE